MTIAAFLAKATAQLVTAGIASARLDVLVLLADMYEKDKAWLLAHDEITLTPGQKAELEEKLARRAAREPLAYIRGCQEFYGHTFIVAPDVLIPRPETEALIEILTRLPLSAGDTIIDVGTGSGAIAISTKLELPEMTVYATDVSETALAIAQKNATVLQADVHFRKSDLLNDIGTIQPDCIIANLPYVDRGWKRSAETNFEPELALFAEDNGLALIKKLITQAAATLHARGYVLLEADPRQHAPIISFATSRGFTATSADPYCLTLQK